MISAPCSKVHLRLVKKLPGQPPSGAIVPWAAAGAWPKFMKQPPLPPAVSRQRPVRSIGGGDGGGGGGGAAASGGGSARLLGGPAAPMISKAAGAFAAGPLHRRFLAKPGMSGSKNPN